MEPIAPIIASAGARSVAPSTGGLTVGQILSARVARVIGDQVQLRWGDQSISVASRVPLTLGQQVSLLVEEAASGTMLLRMVDGALGQGGQGRPMRTEGGNTGRGSGTQVIGNGRHSPVDGARGRTERDPNAALGDQSLAGGEADSGGPGTPGARLGNRALAQVRPGTNGAADGPIGSAPGANGPGQTGTAGPKAGLADLMGSRGRPANGVWTAGLPGTTDGGDPLAALLFEPLDGSAARLAGTSRNGSGTGTPAGTSGARQAGVGPGAFARGALPTYGRMSQGVGRNPEPGPSAAVHGQRLARDVVSPADFNRLRADLGRLLADLGIQPDQMNTVLAGELLAQGDPLLQGKIRGLRREINAVGGTVRDAAPAVALSRLGLPITPLSLAILRQMQAGQLDPPAVWGDLLTQLQRLAHGADAHSQAGVLAAELLADWRVPLEEGTNGVGRWLRTVLDQTASPLEAKLLRPRGEGDAASSPGQDTRARLDLLGQALAQDGRAERASLTQSLQRVQATVQAEQLLNSAPAERAEPRFFAVTLPTMMGQQSSTIELRVREREARTPRPGEPTRPDVVQIRLDLPGLGDLGVNLTIGQHSVACHFAAATPFAEALLSASAGELVGRLKRLGYGHTTVDTAVEAPEPAATAPPAPASLPRLQRVDLNA